MNRLKIIKGDATKPNVEPCVIAHICNNRGIWSKGFVNSLTQTFGYLPKEQYRIWFQKFALTRKIPLGSVQFVNISENIKIANMVCQEGLISFEGVKPIRYEAVEEALKIVMKNHNEIHMPKIGCGLAGGKWCIIEEILVRLLKEYENCNITVYESE